MNNEVIYDSAAFNCKYLTGSRLFLRRMICLTFSKSHPNIKLNKEQDELP